MSDGYCPLYMAAESLQNGCKGNGVAMKVETRGSVGVENEITAEDIAEAHAIIVAADTNVDRDRFQGLTVIDATVQEAIKNPKGLIEKAVSSEERQGYS